MNDYCVDLDGQENKGGQLLSEFKAETVSVDVPLTKERRSGALSNNNNYYY